MVLAPSPRYKAKNIGTIVHPLTTKSEYIAMERNSVGTGVSVEFEVHSGPTESESGMGIRVSGSIWSAAVGI